MENRISLSATHNTFSLPNSLYNYNKYSEFIMVNCAIRLFILLSDYRANIDIRFYKLVDVDDPLKWFGVTKHTPCWRSATAK